MRLLVVVALLLLFLVPAASAGPLPVTKSDVNRLSHAKPWLVWDGIYLSKAWVYEDRDGDGVQDPGEGYLVQPVSTGLGKLPNNAQVNIGYDGAVPTEASIYDDVDRNGSEDEGERFLTIYEA